MNRSPKPDVGWIGGLRCENPPAVTIVVSDYGQKLTRQTHICLFDQIVRHSLVADARQTRRLTECRPPYSYDQRRHSVERADMARNVNKRHSTLISIRKIAISPLAVIASRLSLKLTRFSPRQLCAHLFISVRITRITRSLVSLRRSAWRHRRV